MNYRGDAELKNILHDEFVPLFDRQYPDHPWREAEVRGRMQCNTRDIALYLSSVAAEGADSVNLCSFAPFGLLGIVSAPQCHCSSGRPFGSLCWHSVLTPTFPVPS